MVVGLSCPAYIQYHNHLAFRHNTSCPRPKLGCPWAKRKGLAHCGRHNSAITWPIHSKASLFVLYLPADLQSYGSCTLQTPQLITHWAHLFQSKCIDIALKCAAIWRHGRVAIGPIRAVPWSFTHRAHQGLPMGQMGHTHHNPRHDSIQTSSGTKWIGCYICLITCAFPSLIARFMGQTWAHKGPTGPRWAPCLPHETYYLGYLPKAI